MRDERNRDGTVRGNFGMDFLPNPKVPKFIHFPLFTNSIFISSHILLKINSLIIRSLDCTYHFCFILKLIINIKIILEKGLSHGASTIFYPCLLLSNYSHINNNSFTYCFNFVASSTFISLFKCSCTNITCSTKFCPFMQSKLAF